MNANEFVVNRSGVCIAKCPHCRWSSAPDRSEYIVAGQLVRHLNFAHDAPPEEDD